MCVAWGGYVFIINLIPLHVLVLLVTGRYSNRLYIAYCTLYILGTMLAMQIRFVGFAVRSLSFNIQKRGTTDSLKFTQTHSLISFCFCGVYM